MKRDLVDLLACPVCKGDLHLEAHKVDGEDVLEGSLGCGRCKVSYPIEDGIPNMLPPEGR
jgi:uncharacterized protein YbaR (Trm112 family)